MPSSIGYGNPLGPLQNPVSPVATPVFHLDRLREECAREFATAISDQITVLEILMDPVELWVSFRHKTLDAAQESIGGFLS